MPGPQLLAKGPPLRTPDDLRHHALIHDQAIERDPLVPTWPMWLKAAGVKDVPPTAGLSFSNMAAGLALDAAIAGHGVVLAYSTIAAADIAASAGRLASGCSRWRCPTSSPTTSWPRSAPSNALRSAPSATGCAKKPTTSRSRSRWPPP